MQTIARDKPGGKGNTSIDTARAIAAMLEKLEVAKSMLHGFDRSSCHTQPAAQEHILNQQDGKSDSPEWS